VYALSRAIFNALSGGRGLLSPSGGVSIGVALLGLVVLALRLVVLFVLPGLVTYRLIASVLERRVEGRLQR